MTGYAIARTDTTTEPMFTLTPEPWTVSASCATADPDAWFPEPGGATKAAKAICKACPVINECREYAIRTKQRDGIWAGMAGRQLRKARTGK